MDETLGIGCPLRTGFIISLWRRLGGSLRIKSAKGVTIDNNRLAHYMDRKANEDVERLPIKRLKGDVRIIIFIGGDILPENGMLPVEGLHFSLIRVTISYNSEDGFLEILPTEATQFPPCSVGVTAWDHFTKWAGGLGYGSLQFDANCKREILQLIDPHRFNEVNASTSVLPPGDPLDASLYVLWHWVSASYTVAFSVPLASPHSSASTMLNYDRIKGEFGHLLIPRGRQVLDGEVLRYLQSDSMVLPPGTEQISYDTVQSSSDSDSYPSGDESEDCQADNEPFDWSALEPFVQQIRQRIEKYHSVVPSVNGIYLDDAIWVTNCNVECTCVREVIMLLKSSTYWHESVKQQIHLTLYPGIYFAKRLQLRCFVLQYELVCVEQLFVHENFGFLAKDARPLVEALKDFSSNVIHILRKMDLCRAIFDVTLSTQCTDVELVDIYNFGSLTDGLLHIEDVYHFYYTGVKEGVNPSDKADLEVVDGVLVAFVGSNASRLRKHAWCPKDVGNMNFSTPDDLIDYLRFQTSKCS
ncbi:cell division cycle 123 protein [Babesia ovis]|uniref:Cell division cycle 123 protein n=1 Tax=Babesia ovis TaxID=5869 RepID=A0A9W5T8V1_BABOV|nr:cell division cycle 123 protein [Babesia ovis]